MSSGVGAEKELEERTVDLTWIGTYCTEGGWFYVQTDLVCLWEVDGCFVGKGDRVVFSD
jgi:hypothetical protein